jgi:hypothetical protein
MLEKLGPNVRGIARNVSKRYPVTAQVAMMEKAGLKVIYVEDRSTRDWGDVREAWMHSLRHGDTAVVTWLGLLADPIGNVTIRRRDLNGVIAEIEHRGVSIWELATDRRSTDKKQRDAMIANAWEGLAKQRFDRGTEKAGRPPVVFSPEEHEIIWTEWHSKQHKTNGEAASAASAKMKRHIDANRMWRMVKAMRKERGEETDQKGGSGRRAGRRVGLDKVWDTHKPQVYFLRRDGTDEVKIGYSTQVNFRMANLRGANGGKLTLLATVSGGRDAESRLHKRFSRYRIQGEWYRLDGKLAEYVASLPKPKKPMS